MSAYEEKEKIKTFFRNNGLEVKEFCVEKILFNNDGSSEGSYKMFSLIAQNTLEHNMYHVAGIKFYLENNSRLKVDAVELEGNYIKIGEELIFKIPQNEEVLTINGVKFIREGKRIIENVIKLGLAACQDFTCSLNTIIYGNKKNFGNFYLPEYLLTALDAFLSLAKYYMHCKPFRKIKVSNFDRQKEISKYLAEMNFGKIMDFIEYHKKWLDSSDVANISIDIRRFLNN